MLRAMIRPRRPAPPRPLAGPLALAFALALAACGGSDNRGVPDAGAGHAIDAAAPTPPGAPQDGPGTDHAGSVTADETWSEADGPHRITFDLSIQGATVTIEPCVEVRIAAGREITIGGTTGAPAAALVAA